MFCKTGRYKGLCKCLAGGVEGFPGRAKARAEGGKGCPLRVEEAKESSEELSAGGEGERWGGASTGGVMKTR